MRIVIDVDAPNGMAQGIKEALAMYLERYGDARVVSVTEPKIEQLRIGGTGNDRTADVW